MLPSLVEGKRVIFHTKNIKQNEHFAVLHKETGQKKQANMTIFLTSVTIKPHTRIR